MSDALSALPWVRPFVPLLEGSDSSPLKKFSDLSRNIMLERQANPSMSKDLFYYFVGPRVCLYRAV